MAKRKGSSASRPQAKLKVAKEGSDAKTTSAGCIEDECAQLGREIHALEGECAELDEKRHELEELHPQWRSFMRRRLRLEVKQVQRNLLAARRRLKEVESIRRLDKLPQEVWEKILDNLDENDLFPLALSCRYFRQKQKELVGRTRQSGPASGKPRLALKTNLRDKFLDSHPASAEYLQFCSKEKVPSKVAPKRAQRIMRLAASHGYLPLLQELHKEFELDLYVFVGACKGGHVEIMKWLRSVGCFWDERACFAAAKGGHVEALQWLRREGCPWDEQACAGAAEGGHLEILKWLRSEGCPWSAGACSGAAMGGHLEILKWLRSEGCPWNAWACSGAAEGGHFEILKWLRSEGCPLGAVACAGAAGGGHLKILKWLRSEGCPWNEEACACAAEGGHLEVLKWMRSEGCPWHAGACDGAAKGGHLEILKWLRSEGCP